MADLTEYGDAVVNSSLDEWGSRRLDGLLEDGTRILVVQAGQVYEIAVDSVVQGLAAAPHQCVFGIEKDASVSSLSVQVPESIFNVLKEALTDSSALSEFLQVLGISKEAVALCVGSLLVQMEFSLDVEAGVQVVAEVSVLKEGEVKVTKPFLVMGNVAVDVRTGQLGIVLGG